MKTIILHNLEETQKFAIEFASTLKKQDVVLLEGDLGAGKSEISRQIIRTLCGDETEVPSPTFTLVQEYKGLDFPIFHFDLYRLEYKEEVYELGIEDSVHQGLCLIEWPERLEGMKFDNQIHVKISIDSNDSRRVTIKY